MGFFSLKNKLIGIICGGFSKERAVSIRSGKNINKALKKLGYKTILIDPVFDNILEKNIDIAFIMLHGKYGEDGSIQSY